MTASAGAFRWLDGDRLVIFGRGKLAEAGTVLGSGYALLTTPRAAAAAPALVAAAGSVHEVGPGRVDELAAELRPELDSQLLVALGGGRVIDVAKALGAADPPRMVAAVPTTLSGAEMTAVHRHATGVPAETTHARPAIVVNDPALSASQPLPDLAASAANALGHIAEGPLTPVTNPVAKLAALEAARLIASGLADPEEPDRDALALGALLAGYVVGATGYGLHHVLAQTLVRVAGLGHGQANAIVLPHTIAALSRRSPAWFALLGEALGASPAPFAARLRGLAGAHGLGEAGVPESALAGVAEQASRRAELAMTPPAAGPTELGQILRAAY
ncbi:MAG TPA: iron-containing alcohol dehydrogenase [Solirubrobacteraceae bacterium]|nr:iron-containing alcohol dehydrogenase [Solirubrobacteraceae bacterium]